MHLRNWFRALVAGVLLSAVLLAGFNVAVDPFGLFGDKFLSWWAYDMMQNPLTAMIGWLDSHHADYDSYIVGSSKSSSFPTELLNQYYGGAKFYSVSGDDFHDAETVVSRYGAKNIVVNTGVAELLKYDYEGDGAKGSLHAETDLSNEALLCAKYLFASPDHALQKLRSYWSSNAPMDPNEVFDAYTGVYDRPLLDVEPVGSLSDYLKRHPSFSERNAPYAGPGAVDKCVAAVARMRETCHAAGATFTLAVSPMYVSELDLYPAGVLADLFRKLSSVTDFWDFSGCHSVAYEPRYFYDTLNCRNAVGAMALAGMFGDQSVYVPNDFGVHVTNENVEARLECYVQSAPEALDDDRRVPILMYHNISDDQHNAFTVSTETFRTQIEALKKAGYETIPFARLIQYVELGTPLPEKPVMITFDDGYESVVKIAAPILAQYGMCAAVGVIGVSVGKTTYKDSDVPITPHFSFEEASPWVKTGVLEVLSHSFDMHNSRELDLEHYREGILPMAGESEDKYASVFRADLEASCTGITKALGTPVTVYTYPFGLHTELSEVLLSGTGIKVTLTSEAGRNTVVKGLPQSLRCLKRWSVEEDTSPSRLIELFESPQ